MSHTPSHRLYLEDVRNPTGYHSDLHTLKWWNENVERTESNEIDGTFWQGYAYAPLDEENEVCIEVSGHLEGDEDGHTLCIDDIHGVPEIT